MVLPVLLALVLVPLTSSIKNEEQPLLAKLFLEVLVDVAHVYGSLAKSCPQLGRLLLSVLAAIFFDSSGQFRLALARHLEEGTVTCKHSAVDNLLTLAYCPSSRDASGTVCRTVLDSEATALNWKLYLMAVPGLLLPCCFINIVFGTWVGWTLLSYYAMFHFAKQPFGLLCLYKARQGERDPFLHQLDYWTCMAGAGLPLLLWHAGEFEGFSWFGGEDEKLVELPSLFRRPLWLLYLLVPGAPRNVGKLWVMVAHYFTWYMGMCPHHVRSLAFINLFHGFSSSWLVYQVVRTRYSLWMAKSPQSMRWTDHLNCFLVSTPVAYTCFLCLLACSEDLAWDILINQDWV
eukprot:g20641.t1